MEGAGASYDAFMRGMIGGSPDSMPPSPSTPAQHTVRPAPSTIAHGTSTADARPRFGLLEPQQRLRSMSGGAGSLPVPLGNSPSGPCSAPSTPERPRRHKGDTPVAQPPQPALKVKRTFVFDAIYLGVHTTTTVSTESKRLHLAAENVLFQFASRGNGDAIPSTTTIDIPANTIVVTRSFDRASTLWSCELTHIQSVMQGTARSTRRFYTVIESSQTGKTTSAVVVRFHIFTGADADICERQVKRFGAAFQAFNLYAKAGAATEGVEASPQVPPSTVKRRSPTLFRKMRPSSLAVPPESVTSALGEDGLNPSSPNSARRSVREPNLEVCIGAVRGDSSSKADTYSNVYVKILGRQKEILGMTGQEKFRRDGIAVWNARFSVKLSADLVCLPRPYVTLEVWGKEGGSADACLGACRLLISQDSPSHGSEFSWVSLHRASTLRASIQVQLGWKSNEAPVLTATLPTITQLVPSQHTHLLYRSLNVKQSRLRRLLQFIDLGMRSAPVAPEAMSPGPHGDHEVKVSVPPRSEPLLAMVSGVKLGGVMGVLGLTTFRVVFIPVFAYILESIFKLFRESETEPSHLVVKNHLNQIFGLDTVALHRKDIRDVMAQVTDVVDLSEGRALRRASSLTRAGPRMAGNTCVEGCTAMCGVACLWRRYPPVSVPISTVYKATLLPLDASTGQEDTRASTVEVTAREKQTFFSLSLACKTCQFHNFEVQESDASEFSVAHTFPPPASQEKDNAGSASAEAYSVGQRLQAFVDELKWLSAEGNFASLLVWSTQHDEEPTKGCRSHSSAQLGMFDFSVLTGGDLEERKGDGEEAAAAAAAQVKTPAKPTKPTKKDLKKGWQADSEAAFCVYCNEAFTFLRRRHHCRHCGTVVCDHCSQYRIELTDVGKVRTCVRCYHSMHDAAAGSGELFADKHRTVTLVRTEWEEERRRIRQISIASADEAVASKEEWWNPVFEFSRLRMDVSKSWSVLQDNDEYTLCSTYPRKIVLPARLSSAQIQGAAKFRSKGRLPILSWLHPRMNTPICRSSQPYTGLAGRSSEDDRMYIAAIRTSGSGRPSEGYVAEGSDEGDMSLTIFDARPKVNAMANQFKGKGYERVGHYGGEDVVQLIFLDIANIHVVRSSMQNLVKACADLTGDLFKGIAESKWMNHLSSILKGAALIAAGTDAGEPAIVHCSDGWDRTSQLSSLAQLMLDDYARTTEGFCKLVEKEWVTVGHQFERRCGGFEKVFEQGDSSPIFIQWLDTVYQLLVQFPHHFEFGESLLIDVADAVYSEWFGTFLYDSEYIRDLHVVRQTTFSFWEFIKSNQAKYKNILFVPADHEVHSYPAPLIPACETVSLRFWDGLFRRSSYPEVHHVRRDTELEQVVLSQQRYIQALEQRLQAIEPSSAHTAQDSAAVPVLLLKPPPPLVTVDQADSESKA